MSISQHISDLLYRYECVILPNFGAFITQTESARVHKNTNAFYPPRKVVSFNAQLKTNDGLLVNHIATVNKSNYHSATSQLDAFVSELNSELKQEGSIQLENIGSFTRSEEGKLLFEPSYHINYLSSSFGLSTFTSADIVRQEVAAHLAEEDIASAEIPVKERPVVVLPKQDKQQRPYLKYAAVGILAIGLSGFLGLNYYSGQVEAHNIVEQQKADSQLESQIQQATFIISKPLQPVTLKIEKPKGNYHIVAGAFRVESNADKKVAQLEAKGFKARRIGTNKYGLHQVVYSSFVSRLEALEALRTVKRNENEGAWLLVQELD